MGRNPKNVARCLASERINLWICQASGDRPTALDLCSAGYCTAMGYPSVAGRRRSNRRARNRTGDSSARSSDTGQSLASNRAIESLQGFGQILTTGSTRVLWLSTVAGKRPCQQDEGQKQDGCCDYGCSSASEELRGLHSASLDESSSLKVARG